MAEKFDLKKRYPELYNTGAKARKPHIVEVPPLSYLMIDGTRNPNTSEWFQAAVEALYGVSYGVKFASKAQGRDFGVMPLEGLWWSDPPEAFDPGDKDSWLWTIMIMQPEWVTPAMVAEASESAVTKGKLSADVAEKLRLERVEEGTSVQVLHVGPYSEEGPIIAAMHEFAASTGHTLRGTHHELYLSDARRVAPEKLKTMLRHPVD